MWLVALLLLTAASARAQGLDHSGQEDSSEVDRQIKEGESKMSEQILHMLEHFKQPDPVGLPGANIPEPYHVPDMKQSLAIGTLYFKNTAVYGISQFRIANINVEISEMKVYAVMTIDKIQAKGNYTLTTWLNRAQGPFTVDVLGIKVTAQAALGVERDGKVRAQDIHIDIESKDITMNFENLGFFGTMFQGVINSVSTFLFDSIKPYILKEAYAKARTAMNEEIDKISGDMQFSNSISPLDMVIVEARKKVRNMDLDPYKVKDYNSTGSVFTMTLSHTWLTGISSFHRVGNITLKLENNTLIADVEIGTQKLEGVTQWEISAVGGLLSRAGTASFSVEYLGARVILGQPLDTRKKPEFKDLDLDIGNIQVRCNGAGTLDYVIEAVVNILPNLLRYQIMDGIENPIKEKVQQELNKIDVEEVLHQELPKLDKMDSTEFKLSTLLGGSSPAEENFSDDEFFNF